MMNNRLLATLEEQVKTFLHAGYKKNECKNSTLCNFCRLLKLNLHCLIAYKSEWYVQRLCLCVCWQCYLTINLVMLMFISLCSKYVNVG